jgi:6-phosphogluconolactonase
MSIAIYPDSDTLSHAAARYVVRVASEAITTHGHFTLALAGGSTPKKLYALLASEPYRDQIDWAHTEIFWSDERCVPPDSEDSNYHLAHETLLSKVPLAANQIHRMPADAENHDEASLAYTQEIQRVFGTNGIPSFDLLQLGMGPEAHTASLFPHQASLHEQTRLIIPVTVPKPPPPRLTFTPPLLNAASHILFLVTGLDKAAALQEVLEGEYNPDEYPSQIIRPTKGEVTWMLDPAAASKLRTHHV